MPKTTGKRKHDTIGDVPYASAEKRTKSSNAIFKMNTSIGQHVLRNPGIAQTIVDKADLKQSDVGITDSFISDISNDNFSIGCTRSRPRYGQSDG